MINEPRETSKTIHFCVVSAFLLNYFDRWYFGLVGFNFVRQIYVSDVKVNCVQKFNLPSRTIISHNKLIKFM